MKRVHRKWFLVFHPIWLAAVLLAGLVVALTATSARALPDGPSDVPGAIEGFLYEPNGTTPSEGWIDVHDMEGNPWMGTDAAPDGSFSILNLPPGTYVLRAYPPAGSPHAGSLPVEVEVESGEWATATLLLTEVRVSGYVRDCDAVPEQRIPDAHVLVHNDDWSLEQWDSTDVNGEFKLGGVEIGTPYALEALPPFGSEYVPLDPVTVVPLSTGVVIEMCIPPINIEGVVKDPNGDPVDGAWIVLSNEYYGDETHAEMGHFSFRGLPLDPVNEYWIHAGPPWNKSGQGLMSTEPFTLLVPTPPLSASVVLTLPYAPKTVIGHVRTAETPPVDVPDAEIHARRLDGPGFAGAAADASGTFTLSLTGGEWHLGVRPPHPSAEWIWPGPPAWVVFDTDTAAQTETVDFEVIPTDGWVHGRVVCPDGAPCNGNPPYEDIVPGDIWVEVRNDEISNGMHPNGDYEFAIPISHGHYELVVHLGAHSLQGPEPQFVFVGPGGAYDAGDIHLLLKDAHILGQVRSETGGGVPGIPVVGWQPEGFGLGRAETDASGTYTMPVIGGDWLVEPQPGSEQGHVFRHEPRLVSVAPAGTVAGVDFTVTRADARIEGSAVDVHTHERIWGLDGWSWAERSGTGDFFSDAPMWDGGFELKAKGGYTYDVGLNLPPHAPYVSGSAGPVAVTPGAHVPVTVPLEHKSATIEGHLVDALTGSPPVEPVWAEVLGEDEAGHWVNVGVHPHSASYELGVISGTWHLRAWVDPDSGYVAVPTTTLVTVHAHQTAAPVDFEVWPIEASISGQVQDPDGTPLPGVFVFAEGDSPFVGHFETHAESDPSGHFELHVPEGTYTLGAALPGHEMDTNGWLNPPPVDIPWVSAASPVVGRHLRFRRLDGEIHGTVTLAPGIVVTLTHPAYVWGWSDSGEWAEAEATVVPGTDTFTYSMRVVSDTVWHVGAVYEDWDSGVYYESPEHVVPVLPPGGQAIQDLELNGPWSLPQPFIVSFDGSQMQTIVMPDSTELVIPPGAVYTGTVTLFIFPTKEMRPEPGHEIIGTGYEMWAVDENGREIVQFNKNVILTFYYPTDATLAGQGISEYNLIPVYYSTLIGHWILADSYVLDTVHNEITLQINHFTKFGTMSTVSAEYAVYLPLVLKSFGG